jgi:hypothetical protein
MSRLSLLLVFWLFLGHLDGFRAVQQSVYRQHTGVQHSVYRQHTGVQQSVYRQHTSVQQSVYRQLNTSVDGCCNPFAGSQLLVQCATWSWVIAVPVRLFLCVPFPLCLAVRLLCYVAWRWHLAQRNELRREFWALARIKLRNSKFMRVRRRCLWWFKQNENPLIPTFNYSLIFSWKVFGHQSPCGGGGGSGKVWE